MSTAQWPDHLTKHSCQVSCPNLNVLSYLSQQEQKLPYFKYSGIKTQFLRAIEGRRGNKHTQSLHLAQVHNPPSTIPKSKKHWKLTCFSQSCSQFSRVQNLIWIITGQLTVCLRHSWGHPPRRWTAISRGLTGHCTQGPTQYAH